MAWPGLNGSGRDEIANLVFGVTEPTGGNVEVEGRNLARHRPRQAIRAGLAMVPADRAAFGVIRGHTVRENTSLTKLSSLTRGFRISPRREQREVRHWLKAVNLPGNFIDQGVEQLSGGSQQNVVLAKWMRRRPRVLVLDEPTQGVDVAAKRSIHTLITAAAAEGGSVARTSSGFVLLIIFAVWIPDLYFTDTNLRTLLNQQAVTAIVALGLMVALAAGAFDLSIGTTAGVACRYPLHAQGSSDVFMPIGRRFRRGWPAVPARWTSARDSLPCDTV